MPETQQMYLKEWEDFFKPRQGKELFSFSRLETWLPRLFIGLYTAFILGIVIYVVFECIK